jgi:hypothetical protein
MIGLLCFVVTSTGGVATQGEAPRLSHEQRSLVPRPDVSMVSVDPGGRYDRPARNAGTLASGRLSSPLALEIELAGRAPANRNRIAGTDQADHTENQLWGAPRIHGELLQLGFSVAQSTVAKYIVKRRGPPSQGWWTFLRNHAPDIAAMDLFVVPTIGFKLLCGFVIVRIDRRELIWINVTSNSTAEWIARQITRLSLGMGLRVT